MEKGADIPENAKLGERQGADGEASEPSLMQDADLSFDGSKESAGDDGSKESDGDEVFEEAVETETMTFDLEKGVLIEGRSAEVTGTWEDNENSNLVNEVQKFDEVIGTPETVKRSGDSAINAELLMSARYPNESQIDMEKVVMDEKNGLMCDSNDEDVKGDSVETAASAAPAGKTESSDDGYEVNAKLDKFPPNLDGVLSYNASLVETLTSEVPRTADTDTIEEANLEMSEPSIFSGLREVETAPGMPIMKCYVHETTEVQDSNEAKGGDNGFMRPENGLCDHANLSETLDPNIADIDALLEKTHEASSEIEDANEVKGSEAVPQPESEPNGCVLHNDEQYVMEDVPAAVQGSPHHQDVSIKTSTNLHLGLDDDQFVGQEEKPFVSGTIIIDDENSEMKELNSDCLKTGSQNVEKEENKGITAADTSDMHHVKESSELDADSLPNLEESTANLEIAKVEKSLLSSSELSSNVEHAARTQEPVSHNTSVNRKEVKPAVKISSSANSVTPHPAGLGHAPPLLGPNSQNISDNKERGSRPAADISSENGNLATPTRPAGLGRSASPLEVTSRAVQQPRVNGAISPTQNQLAEDPTNGEAEEYDETREKLQTIRVKFLRLAHRLGQTPHNVVVAQVLYRLGLAEQLQGRSGGRVAAFSFDRASAVAEQLESSGQEPLDFTCTIMVLGKSGVGKSATINSIFDEVMFGTNAFQSGTKMVQDIVGTVQGIRVRVIDTPGLLPSWSDQRQNEKILCSVKKFIKKTPPDIVLYLDRLDMQSRDFSDMPLLRTITEIFGQSIWFNAIVVLTHAASAPPEGPNGTTTSYDMFVTQRSHIVQQAIRQAAGDMRLMNPVSLVENHSACRTNRAGQRVLPNGQVWKPHLLLLSFASKILAEANTLLKLQDNPPGKNYTARARSPPLPFLLSSLLQSRPEVKLPSEQFGDDDDVDDDLSECSDSEDESEYDELPPFNPLTKSQLEKLTKGQRKAYFDELEYREKLFMKKQLKEEKRRRKMMKKMQEAAKDLSADYGENAEEGTSAEASVPVPMPDLALPASFDSDNPTHRYRSLDSSNPWLVRAVLDPNGWDHDIGYDGLNVERLFVIKEKVPISFSGHISKDKKDANLQMEIASSVRHGKGKATSLGFDMQSVGKDIAYTLRSETRFCNHRVNKAAAGLSATVLGDVLTGGMKLEDKLIVGKRGQLVVSGGAIFGRGDIAYGGSLEATLRDKDHPVGHFLSTLGLSVMDWHGDLAIGCNSQTQIPLGRHTNLIGRFNINNRGSGQVSVRINSSEQLQIALIGIIPLVKKILGYSQQVQYG